MLVRISSLFLAAFLVASMAIAKEGQTLFGLVNQMKQELGLSDEQVKQVLPIMKENILKRQEYIESLSGEPIRSDEQFKKFSRKLRRETNEQLKGVLTPEQMQKLKQKQNIRESLNKDVVDFSEGLDSGVSLNPQGGSFQF